MLAEALKGRTVARLKGGDPSIFGRGADETGALRAEGIPFEMIPGITAGLAAAAFIKLLYKTEDLTADDEARLERLIESATKGLKR